MKCVYPPALFESKIVMQKADKPPIATGMADIVKRKSNAAIICKETENFVLEGGFLIYLFHGRKAPGTNSLH